MNLLSKILILTLLCVSCKPEDPGTNHSQMTNGLLVLNEGLFQQNNASLSLVGFDGTVSQQFYLTMNGANLGDVGNDMEIYGGKIYIVVNNSHVVQVVNANTGETIKTISFMNGAVGRSPRTIVFDAGKAYVCSFDGTVARIDTNDLTIEALTQVGRNPESLCIVGSKMFVTNSGGLDYPNYDSTVSVIDIPSFTETNRINVGYNPGKILADDQGDVYLVRRGNYGGIVPRLIRINSATEMVEDSLDGYQIGAMEYENNQLFFSYDSGSGTKIGILNTSSETVSNSDWTDISQITTLYGIKVDPNRQKIYLMDANNYSASGDVFVFDMNGNYENKYGVGYLPSSIVILD